LALDKIAVFQRLAGDQTLVRRSKTARRAWHLPKGHKWQRRYWEHTIRDERDYSRHIDYVHVNPKKHGYVKQVVDWPYSTFHRYVADGLLPVDWCGALDDLTSAVE
jgi:REP-associated tyrosine transposase